MRPAGKTRRRGFAGRLAMAAMLPLVAFPLAASSFMPDFGFSTDALMPLVCEAQRKPFVLEVTAKGELESAINVEVKCEVKSWNNDWIRILEVVPEGTNVKPGDFLVRLDSSGLEADRLQQQILYENCVSALALAHSRCQAALDAKESYLNGEFALKQELVRLKCFVAEEEYRKAKEALAQSRRLAAKGFLTRKQFEADAFVLKKAENDLSATRIELHVLQNLTKARRLKDLDSAITSTKAHLAAREQVLKVHQERLTEIDKQIEKCVIRAPVAGQVVLAHLYHEDHSHLVIPGEMARQGRALIRLPDPSHMQVKAEIDESDVALLKKGLPVTIRLEAFPGRTMQGHVDWVAEYPKPQDWFQDGEKKYEAIVKIDTPFSGLRPGLTADLCICAKRETEAVQLPIQSVLKQGDQSYVVVTDGEKWEALPIEPGPTNGRYTIIRSGLPEGTQVVLDPASYRDKVGLADQSLGAG